MVTTNLQIANGQPGRSRHKIGGIVDVKSLASGSSGNCYVLDDGNSMVMIEIGIPWKKIQQLLNFKTSRITFAISGHRHHDHSGYIKDALKAGIDVYTLQDVVDAYSLSGHRIHAIKPHERFQVGLWKVLPFDVEHDVEALGFLIANGDERLLYLTDSPYTTYRFDGLTHIMVECNFQADLLTNNILSGALPSVVGRRVRRSHFSLENVIAFLKANNLSKCREIHLLHLSSGNSDEEVMKKEIQEVTGIPVYIAEE